MRLEVTCIGCFEKIDFIKNVSDRGELDFEIGKKIELTCNKCYSKRYYHPNSVFAKIRKSIIIIGLIVLVLTSIIVLLFFLKFQNEHSAYIENNMDLNFIKIIFSITMMPAVLFGIIIINEHNKVKIFNSFRIKD